MNHVIEWTGENLLQVIKLTGQNASAMDYKWEDYEQLVKDKGLKIFTPDGNVMASIGDFIINTNDECYVLTKRTKSMGKIFLGGTCAETTWREDLVKMPEFTCLDLGYFNPVVDDWTPECIEIENNEKENLCNIHLYVITKEMQGVYSIAEIVHSAHSKDKTTLLHVIPDGFSVGQLKSLNAVVSLVNSIQGATAYVDSDLKRTASMLSVAKVWQA